jgi:hypothetical protein
MKCRYQKIIGDFLDDTNSGMTGLSGLRKSRNYSALAICLATLFLFTATAQAQVPELEPLNFKAKYDVAFSGIAMGRIRIEVQEDAFSYRMVVDTKTSGLARMFSREKSVAKVEGRIRNGAYFPTQYESINHRNDDSTRRTQIAYDADADIKTLERTPKEDPKHRPPVSPEEANSAYDPITGFLVARSKLRDAMVKNERSVTVRTYDGARLAGLTIDVINPARIDKMGTYVKAINTTVTREPISGYTAKEWKKFKEGDPPIHLYLSADAQLFPIQISVALPFGTLTAKLAELEE